MRAPFRVKPVLGRNPGNLYCIAVVALNSVAPTHTRTAGQEAGGAAPVQGAADHLQQQRDHPVGGLPAAAQGGVCGAGRGVLRCAAWSAGAGAALWPLGSVGSR